MKKYRWTWLGGVNREKDRDNWDILTATAETMNLVTLHPPSVTRTTAPGFTLSLQYE